MSFFWFSGFFFLLRLLSPFSFGFWVFLVLDFLLQVSFEAAHYTKKVSVVTRILSGFRGNLASDVVDYEGVEV